MTRLFWNLMYLLQVAPWETGIVPPEVERLVESDVVPAPDRALDIGCGTGTSARHLARHGFNVEGVDLSSVAVHRARRRAAEAGLSDRCRFNVYDATRLHLAGSPVDGAFDLILDVGCFHGLDTVRRERYRAMIGSLLAPGGHMLQYVHLRPGEADVPARRRTGGWRPRVAAVVRAISRRTPPPQPTEQKVKATFDPICELVSVEHGEDLGRPAAWFLWRRQGSVGRGARSR